MKAARIVKQLVLWEIVMLTVVFVVAWITTPRLTEMGILVEDLPWLHQRLSALHPYFILGDHPTAGGRHALDILIMVPGLGFLVMLWRVKGRFMESTVSIRVLLPCSLFLGLVVIGLAAEMASPWCNLGNYVPYLQGPSNGEDR
jgi:hypothetical protein